MQLFDTPGDTVAEITTDGSTIKPFLNAIATVVDEARLQVEETGLYVQAVDTANVSMGTFHLDATEFDSYDVAEATTIGVNMRQVRSLVRRARKGKDDELELHVQERELTATVSRGYDGTDVVSQGTMKTIDPDSMRSADDLPELETQTVSVGANPFTDALSYAMEGSEYVELTAQAVNQHAEALYLGAETDTLEEHAAITGIDIEEAVEGKYSKVYLDDMFSAIKEVDPDTVTLELASEFPLIAEFAMDGLRVEYCIAPRIEA